MADLSFTEDTTINELAARVRCEAYAKMSEAEFAHRLLFVDYLLEGDLAQVLAILKRNQTYSQDYQLALCWLDGHGYGNTRFAEFTRNLAKVKLSPAKKEIQLPTFHSLN